MPFRYFRVYTDKNSSEIRSYLDATIQELETYAAKPYMQGRKPKFAYFGGGTLAISPPSNSLR